MTWIMAGGRAPTGIENASKTLCRITKDERRETMTLSNASLQQPQIFARFIFRLPLYIYKLGWSPMMSWLPILILTTKGHHSGQPQHIALEYRRHGSKYYVVCGWGENTDWFQNAMQRPRVTIQRGSLICDATAHLVDNPAEALGALYMFSRNSWLYERLFARMSSAQAGDLNHLADVVEEFTVVRLEPSADPPELPPLPLYIQPIRRFALAFVLLMGLGLLLSLRRTNDRKQAKG